MFIFIEKEQAGAFLNFFKKQLKKKKIDNIVNDDLSINDKLDDEVKGFKYDNKILGWIIIIYLIYGILELLLV